MTTALPVLDLFRLNGKNAIVTGANGGIGGGMAIALAEAGANIIIVQVPNDPLRETKEALAKLPIETSVYDCDLASVESIRETIANIIDRDGKTVDILVNCAGVSGHKKALEVDDAFRERIFKTNMTAPYVLTQEVGRRMIARGKGGKILNISSLSSLMAGVDISAYAGTKGAVNQFTSAFANEWAEHGIYVNCLCPGYIATPLTKPYLENESGFNDYVVRRTPLGRWGTPDDFKGITVFLCSSASNYITGARIPVDGGFHGR